MTTKISLACAVLSFALILTACDQSPYPEGVEVVPCKPEKCQQVHLERIGDHTDSMWTARQRACDLLELRSNFTLDHGLREIILFSNIYDELPDFERAQFNSSDFRGVTALERGCLRAGLWPPFTAR